MQFPMDEIRRMSVAERLELIDAIWETIEESRPLPELTDAQRAELDRRLALHEKDPSRTISWAEVRARLHERF